MCSAYADKGAVLWDSDCFENLRRSYVDQRFAFECETWKDPDGTGEQGVVWCRPPERGLQMQLPGCLIK